MVVRDVAGEGGEADIRRKREHGAVRGEAVGPVVPCTDGRTEVSMRTRIHEDCEGECGYAQALYWILTLRYCSRRYVILSLVATFVRRKFACVRAESLACG